MVFETCKGRLALRADGRVRNGVMLYRPGFPASPRCKEGIGATRGTGRNSHVGAPISHTSHNCTVPSFIYHRLSPFVIVFHCLILISLNHYLTPQPPKQDICKQINNAPALTASQTTFPSADSISPFSTLERDNHH